MDENLHNIEDLFRTGLENNEETPPGHVWDKIENTFDKENVINIQKKYDNLKKVAAVLLLLLICFSVFEIVNEQNGNDASKGAAIVANTLPKKNTNEAKIVTKNTTVPANTPENIDNNTNINQVQLNKEKPNLNNNSTTNRAKNNSQVNIHILNNKSKQIQAKTKLADNKESNGPVADRKLIIAKPGQLHLTNPFLKNIKVAEKSIASNDAAGRPGKRDLLEKSKYKIKIESPTQTEMEQKDESNADTLTQNIQNKALIGLNNNSKNNLQNSPTGIIAKTKKSNEGKPSRFSATLFFLPEQCWYHLKNDAGNNSQDSLAGIGKSKGDELSSTYGTLLEYRLSKHWGLQSGVLYSSTTTDLKPKTIYASADADGKIKYLLSTPLGYGYVLPKFANNPVAGDSVYSLQSEQSVTTLSVPLGLKYNIPRGKFNFTANLGITANFILKGKIETEIENGSNNEMETVDNIQGLRKFYFGGLAGLGVDYNFTKKIGVSISPTYRFALNSINKNPSIKTYPNSIGLLIGLKINL